ncbi:DUF6344 domain-containing protein [Streptomyces himalayensis]|uniref:Uncharacterized protein n=2 Tax=Streptomyces himalayensis TaxID=2820085 RepID=A0A7W2D1C0_9ACTN|nr:DUF6344 domain-containing protein [Streptomyces himalayensis]MBA2945365.1 hypothetical protein [Streptomyces himalayensis subsp. himalayensis]MBA4862898.1 hypothetical protein [Streptomyces himalayensis subsp. aureolus]
MAANKVVKLWTLVISAFLAVLAALGFTTAATAAAPVQQPTESCNGKTDATAPAPRAVHWRPPHVGALPPTMKQRIHAEAHGSSPTCRRLPALDAASARGTANVAEVPAL